MAEMGNLEAVILASGQQNRIFFCCAGLAVYEYINHGPFLHFK
jgi:hypothetical protein